MIVGEKQMDRLVMKYIGVVSPELTNDEREILLMALYMESEARGGLVKTSVDGSHPASHRATPAASGCWSG